MEHVKLENAFARMNFQDKFAMRNHVLIIVMEMVFVLKVNAFARSLLLELLVI
jgi:hypothetical protein